MGHRSSVLWDGWPEKKSANVWLCEEGTASSGTTWNIQPERREETNQGSPSSWRTQTWTGGSLPGWERRGARHRMTWRTENPSEASQADRRRWWRWRRTHRDPPCWVASRPWSSQGEGAVWKVSGVGGAPCRYEKVRRTWRRSPCWLRTEIWCRRGYVPANKRVNRAGENGVPTL